MWRNGRKKEEKGFKTCTYFNNINCPNHELNFPDKAKSTEKKKLKWTNSIISK